MPSALAFIGGGLLQGVGKGLVLDGKAKRERALADLEHTRDLERDEKRLEGRRGLLGERLESDRDLAATREAGADRRLGLNIDSRETLASEAATSREDVASKATTSREKIAAAANVSREEAARITAGKAKDTTAAEDRIIERHVEIDENGVEIVDHEAAAVELEDRGFKKAASAQRRKDKGIADQDIRKRAEQFADDMVEEQAGFISSDAADFKDDGGSRTRFRARMVREFIAKNGGKAAVTPTTKPAATSDDPYVGEAPPPSHPEAKRAKDGFWYVERDGKFLRVQNSEANRAPSDRGRQRGRLR